MNDFEDLTQLLAFPGVGVQLAALARLQVVIEKQLEVAQASELRDLRARHAALRPHPEDAALDTFEVESLHAHYFPKVFRGGFVLMLWAAMESAVKSITHYAATKVGDPLGDKHFSRALFAPAEEALATRVGVDLFADKATRDGLELLRQVRNALVHHDGDVRSLPARLRRLSGPHLELLGLVVERDLHRSYVVPTEAFVDHQVRLVSNFLRRLDSVVFAALHPTSCFNE